MPVVYLDSVFLLNAAMDYLLLRGTELLSGVPAGRQRCVLAALFGGGYAAAVFLPGLGWLSAWPGKLLAGLLMAVIAFGGQRRFLRRTLLFFALSCGMAGCVLALGMLSGGMPVERGVFYTRVDLRVLLVAAISAYLLLSVVFRAAAGQGMEGKRLPLRIHRDGREIALSALYDSGNALRDAGGRPVAVLTAEAARGLFPPELRRYLTAEALRDPAGQLAALRRLGERPVLLPCRTVGGGGLLLALRCDWLTVNGVRQEGPLVALTPEDLGNGIGALWGGEEGGDHGDLAGKIPAFSCEPGPADGARRPLHRRQRRAAAAPEPGAGGGAPVPARGPGGPGGAHRT